MNSSAHPECILGPGCLGAGELVVRRESARPSPGLLRPDAIFPSLETASLLIAMLRSLVPELGPLSPSHASRLHVTKSALKMWNRVWLLRTEIGMNGSLKKIEIHLSVCLPVYLST